MDFALQYGLANISFIKSRYRTLDRSSDWDVQSSHSKYAGFLGMIYITLNSFTLNSDEVQFLKDSNDLSNFVNTRFFETDGTKNGTRRIKNPPIPCPIGFYCASGTNTLPKVAYPNIYSAAGGNISIQNLLGFDGQGRDVSVLFAFYAFTYLDFASYIV